MRVISFEKERTRRGLPVSGPSQPGDLPELDELLPAKAGRPGELHEHVPLGDIAAGELKDRSNEVGVEPDVIAAIAIEVSRALELLSRDDDSQFQKTISNYSKSSTIVRRLTSAEARYVRSLTSRRKRASTDAVSSISLALRLTATYSEAALLDGLRSGWLAEAVNWEIAALVRGQTLTELILLSALGRE